MKSQSQRLDAEERFVRGGQSLDQISAAMGVSKGSLARWSAAGKWAEKRAVLRRESPSAAVNTLKRQRQMMIDLMAGPAAADPAAVDALHKLTLIIEKMEARADAIGPTLDVMERFARFVAAHCSSDESATVRACAEKFLDEERKNNA